ncbi:MAG: Ppx/GppA family phosphatase [Bacillota bacterium]
MKAASIDIGTNSSRLLIVDYIDSNYKIISQKLITTRLGTGVDKNKLIKEKAIDRLLKALNKFQQEINKYQVKKVKMIGTSALREVKNADSLIELIYNKTGYKLEIIDGLKEAEYTYRGVSIDLPFDNFMIIDIGGGSTEFIWKEEQVNFESLNIGAVRMTERFISDPETELNKLEKEQIEQFVAGKLEKRFERKKLRAVGVGGTITTSGAIDLKLDKYNRKKIHKYTLKFKVVLSLLNKLSQMNIKEREEVTGLNPERADIIVAGISILKQIMEFFGFEEIVISEKDLLFGIIRGLI